MESNNEIASFSSGEIGNEEMEMESSVLQIQDFKVRENVGYGMVIGGVALITSIMILGLVSLINRG